MWTKDPDQPLKDQSNCKGCVRHQIVLCSHMGEARNYGETVLGMDRGEGLVARLGRLNEKVRCDPVAELADHDDVWFGAQHLPKALCILLGPGFAIHRVSDRILDSAPNFIFRGILNGHNVVATTTAVEQLLEAYGQRR